MHMHGLPYVSWILAPGTSKPSIPFLLHSRDECAAPTASEIIPGVWGFLQDTRLHVFTAQSLWLVWMSGSTEVILIDMKCLPLIRDGQSIPHAQHPETRARVPLS